MTTWESDIEVYSYEVLWRASQSALKTAAINDTRIRPDHLAIQSLLTGFMAFEGFLNYIGETIANEVWKDERNFFSHSQYRGITGKVEYLYSKFNAVTLNKGIEPFQTYAKIKETRDLLAHNRLKKYSKIKETHFSSFETHWDDFDSPEKVFPALEKLKEFAEMIRLEAVKLMNDDYKIGHIYFEAFTGPLGSANGIRKD